MPPVTLALCLNWRPTLLMIGIVKFFKNESFLDALISGTICCNTPESYRLSNLEGVSDFNESCLFTFRPERGDEKISIEINGKKISDIKRMTAYNPGLRDGWLHCWMSIEIPKNDDELEALTTDVQRLQEEFGRNYAFISYDKIEPFFNIIKDLFAEHQVIAWKVAYSEKSTDWSPICKASSYSYQREFRFIIGKCKTNHIEPLVRTYKEGEIIGTSMIL
jgi:hypothetical protein